MMLQGTFQNAEPITNTWRYKRQHHHQLKRCDKVRIGEVSVISTVRKLLAIPALLALLIGGPIDPVGEASAHGEATLTVTLRGCEGTYTSAQEIDPRFCTEYILPTDDARFYNVSEDDVVAEWHFDVVPHPGDYSMTDMQAGDVISMINFEPGRYDAWTMFGDGYWNSFAQPEIKLQPGDNRITISYYNTPDGDSSESRDTGDQTATYPVQGTVTLMLHSCPSGVDPFAECNTVIEANGASAHTGHRGLATDLDNFLVSHGLYEIPAMAESGDTARVTLLGLEPGSHDDNLIIGATARTSQGEFYVDVPDGETVNVNVFYYHYD